MSITTAIQWTDATWNIARGCTKVDADCKYCYMYRQSLNGTRHDPMQVLRTKTVFNLPLRLKQPSKIFTCSLTDFYHPAIDSYRHEAWEIMQKCPQHIFQILTKRPERIIRDLPFNFGNIWWGTSCGCDGPTQRQRMEDLIKVRNQIYATCLFLSLEPLYGPITLPVDANDGSGFFDWVIVGGESGNDKGLYRYRPCKLEWIESIVEQAKTTGAAVFVKQLGTHLAKQLGLKDRHGGNMDEWPQHLQIRQFPKL